LLGDARAKLIGVSADSEGDIMNRPRFLLLAAVVLTAVAPSSWTDHAAGQEVALTPLVNDKDETIGRINDFIFGKDGNIYAVLAVGDFVGLSGYLVAIPFRSLKLDHPSGYVVLPGASRAALEKLPVFVNKR
jgi:hypothetical protein